MNKFIAGILGVVFIVVIFTGSINAPPNDLPWYFVGVFGDNRPPETTFVEYPSVYYQIISELNVSHPFAVIGTGDHTGRGFKTQIEKFLETTKNLENVFVIMGNHDLNPTTRDYWYENVAEGLYYVDIIPGWRFIFVDYYHTEVLWNDALDFLHDAASTTRNKILVIHRPIEPLLDHNMPEPVRSELKNLLENYEFKIVLQGHWHGYADVTINDVRYLVVGGGGAPLYSHPNGLKKYCYTFLILWPNGSYDVIPVDPLSGSISIHFTENSVKITNTKLDVYGNPTMFPLRVPLYGKYVVLLAPNGVSYVNVTNGSITVSQNVEMWYTYDITEVSPQETPTTTTASYNQVFLIVVLVLLLITMLEISRRIKRR